MRQEIMGVTTSRHSFPLAYRIVRRREIHRRANSAISQGRSARINSKRLFGQGSIRGDFPASLCFSIQAMASAVNRPGVAMISVSTFGESQCSLRCCGASTPQRNRLHRKRLRLAPLPVRRRSFVMARRRASASSRCSQKTASATSI